MIRAHAVVLIALAQLALSGVAVAADFGVVQVNTNTPAAFSRYEVTFELASTYANPFDVDEVDVHAEITLPGGADVIQPGFVYHPYVIDETNETVTAAGDPVWKVRYTPTVTGLHAVALVCVDAAGTNRYEGLTFTVREAAPAAAGFLVMDLDRSSQYFVDTHTGEGWFGVGFDCDYNTFLRDNVNHGGKLSESWVSAAGSRYFPPMVGYGPGVGGLNEHTGFNIYSELMAVIDAAATNGANAMRFLADAYYYPLEIDAAYQVRVADNTYTNAASLGFAIGRYHPMMTFILDEVFERCEQYGIRVITYMWNGLKGGTPVNWGGQQYAFWDQNETLVKRRIRYHLARWGYSTSYWTTQYFNEVEANPFRNPGGVAEVKGDPFWDGITDWIHQADIYGRPVSSSDWGVDHEVRHWYTDFADTSTDIVIDYLANPATSEPRDCTNETPVVWEEFGKHDVPSYEDLSTMDPNAEYPRMGYFGALVGGKAAAMAWWIRPAYCPRHMSSQSNMYWAISHFMDGEEGFLVDGSPWQHLNVATNTPGLPLVGHIANADADRAYLYIVRTPCHEIADRSPVSGRWITLPMNPAHNYRVEWWNCRTGEKTTEADLAWDAGAVRIDIPDAVPRDIAAKVVIAEDVTPPRLVASRAFHGRTRIELDFDEPLSPETATNAANYTLSDGLTTTNQSLASKAITLHSSSPLYAWKTYALDIANVTDLSSNAVAPTRVLVSPRVCATNLLTVTFQNVPGGALTNFPALLKLNEQIDGFSYTSFISRAGQDLRLWDVGMTTNVDYEIERWDTNGTSFVWVRVPVMTNGVMLRATWCVPDQTEPFSSTTNGAVWANGYVGVWHLGETNGPPRNWAIPTNTATQYRDINQAVDGAVGDAHGFASNAYWETSHCAGTDLGGTGTAFTLSGWIRRDDLSGTDDSHIVGRWPGAGGGINNQYVLKHEGDGDYIKLYVYSGTNFPGRHSAADTVPAGRWLHVAGVGTGSELLPPYLDGTPSDGGPSPYGSSYSLVAATNAAGEIGPTMGGWHTEGRLDLDEIRISAVARSADWIRAEYLTMASNDWLTSYGTVSSSPGLADGDHDDLPDEWERLYLGSTDGMDCGRDDDWYHDGATNIEELWARTNPGDPLLALRFTGIASAAPTSTAVTVRWTSEYGLSYRVLAFTNLVSGAARTAAVNQVAEPPENTASDTSPDAHNCFFRVVIE